MAATTTSSTCSAFFTLRSSSNSDDPSSRVARGRDTSSSSSSSSSSNGSSSGCSKIDGVAMWFINGVTMAFFASLNRCSCIRIVTDEEDGEDANDLPLMLNDGNIRHDGAVVTASGGTTSKRRTAKGKRSNGSALVHEQD